MKKPLTYLLLFSYCLMLIKPVLPVITDSLAHTFWYASHIATVHYENGKYHIHKEILDDAKKSNTEKNNATVKSSETNDAHLIVASVITHPFSNKIVKKYSSTNYPLHLLYFNGDYPPPKI